MNRWSILTVVAALFCFASFLNAIWQRSVLGVIGFAVIAVATYWVVTGCARRGEPLASRLVHR